MVAIGAILLLVAVLAWGGFLMQRFKGGRLDKAPFVKTGDLAAKGDAVAGEKGAVSVEGKLNAPQLLTSPVTGTECLYYQVQVTAKWKSGENNRSQEIMHDKKACEFTLDDGSGPVGIDANKGGDFDMKQTFSKKRGMGLKAVVTGGEVIEFGDHGFGVRPGMKIKGVKIPMSADYQVTEKVFLPIDKAYVCGKWQADASAVTSPSWTSLILTAKSREELVGATAKTKERAKLVGMITTPAAILFFILGAVFGGGDKKSGATEPSNTNTVEAAAAKPAAAPAAKPAAAPAAKPAGKTAAKPAAAPAPAPAPAPTAEAPAAAPAPSGGGLGGGGRGGKRR